jgi:hypothetical protein
MNTILVAILTIVTSLLALILEYVTRPTPKPKTEKREAERRDNGQYKRKIPVHYWGETEYLYL